MVATAKATDMIASSGAPYFAAAKNAGIPSTIGDDQIYPNAEKKVSLRTNLNTQLTPKVNLSLSIAYVGVENLTIPIAQQGRHRRLPRGDPAGESDAQHQGWDLTAAGARAPRRSLAALTVLLISMAMVSGPTPPGTGVYAPATSTTSG